MAIEHDPAAAKRVCEQAVRACLDVTALDPQHALRVREVPGLAGVSLFEPRQHQLRAHCPVAEKRPFSNCVLYSSLHAVDSELAGSRASA